MRLSCTEFHYLKQGQCEHATTSVCSVGSEAYRLWQSNTAGQVLAVFRRSAYLQCNGGVICIGDASLGKGPLHVLLSPDEGNVFGNLASGHWIEFDKANRSNSSSCVVDTTEFPSLKNNSVYTGHVACIDTFSLSRHHVEFLDACALLCSAENCFCWLLHSQHWQALLQPDDLATDESNTLSEQLKQYVLPPLQTLYMWLADSLQCPANVTANKPFGHPPTLKAPFCSSHVNGLVDVNKLLGAGPGLTPAGDDLLAGVLLALHRVGRVDLAAFLWCELNPWLERNTNVISGAHLRMAAQGQCSEHMLALLDLVINSNTSRETNDIRQIARDVQTLADRMGASSGWDTLAGVGLVMRAMSVSICPVERDM